MIYTDAEIRTEAQALAPELASVADATLDARIPWCRAHASAEVFGDYQLTALAYLLAHRTTMDLRATGGTGTGSGAAIVGAVTSRKSGKVAESYGASVTSAWAPWGPSDAELAQNPYGLAFLSLRGTRSGAVSPMALG